MYLHYSRFMPVTTFFLATKHLAKKLVVVYGSG